MGGSAAAPHTEDFPPPHLEPDDLEPNLPDIPELAGIARDFAGSGGQILATVKGEPKDARETLQKLSATGGRLDAIACTQVTGAWLVFSDLKTDFPALGQPRVIMPRSYRWPNFLKSENLLNIANQIAVIAIVAIGMTMVIITGGIDLSVGSLLALSAVLTAGFIRDFAGGVNASFGGMLLACLAAIALCGIVGAFSGAMITRFAIPPFIVTLAMMLVGDVEPTLDQLQQRIRADIGFLIGIGQHLHAGTDEEDREDIENPGKFSDNGRTQADHNRSKNDDAQNTPEQNAVLIALWDGKEGEDHRDDKDVINRQRLFNRKAREISEP
jgi:hypothetical protein